MIRTPATTERASTNARSRASASSIRATPGSLLLARERVSRSDWVETFKVWFCALLAAFYGLLLLILAAALLFIYSAAKADGVPVPQECVLLAKREGFPTDVLTKAQAARARLRLARLSDRDPIVKACREAVRGSQ